MCIVYKKQMSMFSYILLRTGQLLINPCTWSIEKFATIVAKAFLSESMLKYLLCFKSELLESHSLKEMNVGILFRSNVGFVLPL